MVRPLLSRPEFLSLFRLCRSAGRRGNMQAQGQLHFPSWHTHAPTTHANGACMCALARCSHRWGCTRSPATSAAQFQTSQGLVMSRGLLVGDPWSRQQIIQISIPLYYSSHPFSVSSAAKEESASKLTKLVNFLLKIKTPSTPEEIFECCFLGNSIAIVCHHCLLRFSWEKWGVCVCVFSHPSANELELSKINQN